MPSHSRRPTLTSFTAATRTPPTKPTAPRLKKACKNSAASIACQATPHYVATRAFGISSLRLEFPEREPLGVDFLGDWAAAEAVVWVVGAGEIDL
ncbi:hypothetical protein NT6N_37660 [Oceaniferula spumae]|uniref:Uncharacterized protein n=1 Tax=Oceaniferula spumae TaxID=2979115 RepID=A0AAT9FRS1_9BACT